MAVFRLDRSIRRRRLKNPFIKRILTHTEDQGKGEGDGIGLFFGLKWLTTTSNK
jgi:hypothetical protein